MLMHIVIEKRCWPLGRWTIASYRFALYLRSVGFRITLTRCAMGLSDQAFEVMCPDCGAMLKVDPVTRAIISHKSAPKKKMFEDFGEAAKALREADARRESIFAPSVDPQTNKDKLTPQKFA